MPKWIDRSAQDALLTLNLMRQQLGMQVLQPDSRLARAAQAHANYLLRNKMSGHDEHAGNAGFTGRTPQERAITAGYTIDATFAMPVQVYVNRLKQYAGEKLILFDPAHGRVIGEVAGRHVTTDQVNLQGMSMRARDITADLPDAFQDHVFKQVGERARACRFLIVLPMSAEQQFEKRIADQLRPLGIAWADISSISLRYEQSGSHINAFIEKVNINGATRKIGRLIEVW